MPTVRSSLLALLAVVWHVTGHAVASLARPAGLAILVSPTGFTVLSTAMLAAVLTGLVVAVLADGARIARAVTAVPLVSRAAGFREKSWCAAFLPQRDPDAAGRTRPRAPSAAPAAA